VSPARHEIVVAHPMKLHRSSKQEHEIPGKIIEILLDLY
jgi:hypothetical protein